MIGTTPIPAYKVPVSDVSLKVVKGKDISAYPSNGLVVGQYATVVVTLEDNRK